MNTITNTTANPQNRIGECDPLIQSCPECDSFLPDSNVAKLFGLIAPAATIAGSLLFGSDSGKYALSINPFGLLARPPYMGDQHPVPRWLKDPKYLSAEESRELAIRASKSLQSLRLSTKFTTTLNYAIDSLTKGGELSVELERAIIWTLHKFKEAVEKEKMNIYGDNVLRLMTALRDVKGGDTLIRMIEHLTDHRPGFTLILIDSMKNALKGELNLRTASKVFNLLTKDERSFNTDDAAEKADLLSILAQIFEHKARENGPPTIKKYTDWGFRMDSACKWLVRYLTASGAYLEHPIYQYFPSSGDISGAAQEFSLVRYFAFSDISPARSDHRNGVLGLIIEVEKSDKPLVALAKDILEGRYDPNVVHRYISGALYSVRPEGWNDRIESRMEKWRKTLAKAEARLRSRKEALQGRRK